MWIKRAGKARVTYAGGSTYEGDFNDEKMKDGTGKYVWMEAGEEDEEPKEKAVYEGQYKDGKRTGTGSMRYPNKDEYTGEWKENKMHGTGTYKYAKTSTAARSSTARRTARAATSSARTARSSRARGPRASS